VFFFLVFSFPCLSTKLQAKKKALNPSNQREEKSEGIHQEAQGTRYNCNDFDFVELESLKECLIWDLGVQFHGDGNLRLAANWIYNCEIPDV
jgi:hypothetical protein